MPQTSYIRHKLCSPISALQFLLEKRKTVEVAPKAFSVAGHLLLACSLLLACLCSSWLARHLWKFWLHLAVVFCIFQTWLVFPFCLESKMMAHWIFGARSSQSWRRCAKPCLQKLELPFLQDTHGFLNGRHLLHNQIGVASSTAAQPLRLLGFSTCVRFETVVAAPVMKVEKVLQNETSACSPRCESAAAGPIPGKTAPCTAMHVLTLWNISKSSYCTHEAETLLARFAPQIESMEAEVGHKIVDACGCLVHLSTLGLHVCQKPHGFLICSKSLQATEGIWTLDISGHMTLNPLRLEVWHWRSPLDQSAGFSQVMCQLHFYALRESIYLCTFLT